MARELRRLLIEPGRLPVEGRQLALEQGERHYLGRVLRLRPGERFALCDGTGRLWTALLTDGGAVLEQPAAEPLQRQPCPTPRLTLAVAMPRRDGEVMARMACELGVDGLLPLQAERSVGDKLRPDRLTAILREAAEQCERLWLPELLPLQSAAALLGVAPAGVGLLATTRAAGVPLLDVALAQSQGNAMDRLTGGVTLAIGPEGGWSPAEQAQAQQAGWQAVSLGSSILRVSTAAVAGAAALVRWRLGLTCPSCSWPSP